jgi:NAD(P)-dependent dehydrogenase (short-subunit alcohol dehydrogenase family)
MSPFPSPTKIWRTEPYPTISPTRPELSAKGKVVLITGGGTGIGASTARAFAQAGAARIALLGRREKPLQEAKASIQKEYPGVDIFVAPTDVTEKNAVDAAFANFAGHGSIDVVVSNAGFIGPQEPVAEVTDTDGFLNAIHINVAGALYVAQAFSRHASKDAVVIEVNSSAAHVNFAPGFTAYSTAKMAVFKLWDSFAFGHPNLRVYHVQPGTINTDMNKEAGGVAALGFEDSGKYSTVPIGKLPWLIVM